MCALTKVDHVLVSRLNPKLLCSGQVGLCLTRSFSILDGFAAANSARRVALRAPGALPGALNASELHRSKHLKQPSVLSMPL
jgi:hypothetical protein